MAARKAHADVAAVLLAPYTNLANLLHVTESEDAAPHWLTRHAAATRRVSDSALPNDASVSFDVIVDEGRAEGFDNRVAHNWPQLQRGGTYLFALAPATLPSVQSWLIALTDKMGVADTRHKHHHYMGRETLSHRKAQADMHKHPLPDHASFLLCTRSGCGLTKVGPCECQPGTALRSCAARTHLTSIDSCAASSHRNNDTVTLAREAMSRRGICDKISMSAFHVMYGALLTPLARRHRGGQNSRGGMRLFEIGLGCNMEAGPSACHYLWKHLFQGGLDLWQAEIAAQCVALARKRGQLDGVTTLVGDQGNATTLREWRRQMGDDGFDAIIDDGGHKSSQIASSFEWFWPIVRPGGTYFIEDMHVGYMGNYEDSNGAAVMPDVVRTWMAQLAGQLQPDAAASGARKFGGVHKLPDGTSFIACQTRGCAIGKHHL